jgi:hypothetical protein
MNDNDIVDADNIDQSKEVIPHQAEILFRAEIMQRLPDGRTSGFCLKSISEVFTLFGDSLEECINNVQSFVKEIKKIPEETIKKNAAEVNNE